MSKEFENDLEIQEPEGGDGEETQERERERRKGASQRRSARAGAGRGFLHFLQHLCFAGAVLALFLFLFGGLVEVHTKNGTSIYQLSLRDTDTAFEDSEIFNRMLGQSVSDIICYGTIRSQMETDGVFDPEKQVDVTAFANRYEPIPKEYITARYYLDDLIKWAQSGLEYNEVYLSAQEADQFLSRYRTVTVVEDEDYEKGMASYLNSDMQSHTTVVDVSGNLLPEDGGSIRDDVNATILYNRYRSVEGKNIENYVSSWNEYYELRDNLAKAAQDLDINYQEYLKYREYYDESDSNVVYYIRRTVGGKTEIYSNQKVSAQSLSALERNLKEQCGKYIIYNPYDMIYETNTLVREDTVRHVLGGYDYSYPEDTQILVGVRTALTPGDAFADLSDKYNRYSPYMWQYLATAVVLGIFYVGILAMLTILEGRAGRLENGKIRIRLRREDKISTELMAFFGAAAAIAFFLIVGTIQNNVYVPELSGNYAALVLICLFALLVSLVFSFVYYSFVRRVKAGTLWRDSLVKRLGGFAKKEALYFYDHSAVVLRTWIPYGGFLLLHVLLVVIGLVFEAEVFILMLLLIGVIDLFVGVVLYRMALDRQKILEGIKRINSGDMEHKIDESQLHGDNLVLAREVNGIGEGIRNAVATSMKDERLKADLITNVSHDIKTPLTSIINYVDLIKRENIDDSRVKEYVEVLDAKSQRLKQLTDDLVEASKISSGNIVLQWEKINLVELLNQTIGEFSEKFEQKALVPVFRCKKNNLVIEADSRRIWRVIENLFNNICKYALEGTRIYIDLSEFPQKEAASRVELSIRNISKNPVMVDSDELTERFIRGDESRTTEGSGLGLSIAKNLTEAMRGKFEIVVDGDLFKVILTFPLFLEIKPGNL